MNHKLFIFLFVIFTLLSANILRAQEGEVFSLQQLKDSALKSNHLLTLKDWQIKEKKAKIQEDAIKKYPVANLNANYDYIFFLGSLTIPPGTIGEIPLSPTNTVQLPNKNESFPVGSYNNYNFGISLYQPITQQAKIKTGLEIDKIDVSLTEQDKLKYTIQLEQKIEQLYYGTLISQKQMVEANANLELSTGQLTDIDNDLFAGKTITANRAGLQANVADEEQNILKLNIQIQNYLGDLINLTRINANSIRLEEPATTILPVQTNDEYQKIAAVNNPDLEIADKTRLKALLGVKAAKQSNRPDLGLVAGYAYQLGNPVLPANNPFVGVSLKWNLQDIFSSKHIIKQREFQLRQTEEYKLNTQEQVSNDINKAYRNINQSKALIAVAEKVVMYRKEEMKLQQDKQAAGLNMKTELLNTISLLSKAEADMYSAQLSYALAVSDLTYLIGYK